MPKPRAPHKPLVFPAGASVNYSEPGLEYRIYTSGDIYRKRIGEPWEKIDHTTIPERVLDCMQAEVSRKMAEIVGAPQTPAGGGA